MQEVINAVVIDNDVTDLMGVSVALAKKGISTVPVHYQGIAKAQEAYDDCTGAANALPRIIITDIQMNEGGATPSSTDLGNVATCIQKIVEKINGPYILLAWTSIPEHFQAMKSYVEKFLNKSELPLPIYFESICKTECKPNGGTTYCPETILSKVTQHLDTQAQFKALMHWERRVLNSAIGSVNELLNTCEKSKTDLETILNALALSVAGRNLSGYESVAINESLSYLLKDTVSQSCIDHTSSEVWKAAISGTVSDLSDTAKHYLNTLLHFDKNPSVTIICPGDLWTVSKPIDLFNLIVDKQESGNQIEKFKEEFFTFKSDGYKLNDEIIKLSNSYKLDKTNNEIKVKLDTLKASYQDDYTNPKKTVKNESRIVAIEISPVCDFSNKKKALKTIVLGLLVPSNLITENVFIKKSDSIIGCRLILKEQPYQLVISAKYMTSMSEVKLKGEELGFTKELRVRESILQSWIHFISAYNSRIGTVSFG